MTRMKPWLLWPFVMAATLLITPIAAAQPPETRKPVVETQEVGLAYYQERVANEGWIINRTGPRSMSLLLPAVQFRIVSLDSEGAESDVWGALLSANGEQRMRLDLQISKRVDKTSPQRTDSFFDEADALFGKVAISGQTQAQLNNGLTWRARIDGDGRCEDAQCVIHLEMVGRLKRGVDTLASVFVGDMRLGATAIFDRESSDLTFTTPGEHDVDAVGDMTIRVMPGDNVQ